MIYDGISDSNDDFAEYKFYWNEGKLNESN